MGFFQKKKELESTEDLCKYVRDILWYIYNTEKKNDETVKNGIAAKMPGILKPAETEKYLETVWQYPVLTEHYDRNQELIYNTPYVLIGALEIDISRVFSDQRTYLWLKDILRGYYPDMIETKQNNDWYIYLPYTVDVQNGALIALKGQGRFSSRTVASIGQRILKALIIKEKKPRVFVTTDSSNNPIPEFDWLKKTNGMEKVKPMNVNASRAIQEIEDFLKRDGCDGTTVILGRCGFKDPKLFKNLQKAQQKGKLSQNGNTLYVIGCFEECDENVCFSLDNNKYWMRNRDIGLERLLPFRISKGI